MFSIKSKLFQRGLHLVIRSEESCHLGHFHGLNNAGQWWRYDCEWAKYARHEKKVNLREKTNRNNKINICLPCYTHEIYRI